MPPDIFAIFISALRLQSTLASLGPLLLRRMRLFLEGFRQTFHQRLQILIETPGDLMPIHPQFNARHNLRLLSDNG